MEIEVFEPMSSHKLNHCVVNEYKLEKNIANDMLNECIKFKHDYIMGGRNIIQFGNDYLYSGLNHVGREHTEFTSGIIELCNSRFKTDFNSILMNVYPAGKMVGIGKHSDSEEGLEYDPIVLSISLGSSDFFNIVSNNPYDDEYLTIPVQHGSVILMDRGCQLHYQHYIKPSVRQQDRISLTFRKFV